MAKIDVPATMRALLYNRPAQTLELVNSWPTPKPDFEKGEHLLKVNSTSMTKGELDWPFPPETYEDYSPGVDMSGIVVACPSTSKFPVGSKVYMRTNSPRSGSAREYTIGLESDLASMPHNITMEQGAAVPTSALTAWQAFFVQAGYSCDPDRVQSRLDSSEKKKVLIIGASGSVGAWATQIAHVAGYWVVGTCHTRNVAFVRSLGADDVIDYTQMSIGQWMEDANLNGKFDLVLDCAKPNTVDAWHAAHPEHGLILSIVPFDDMVWKWTLECPEGIVTNAKGRFFILTPDGDQLKQISQLIEAGKLMPIVDSVFDFDNYKTAFERFKSGKTTGKVVIQIQKP